MEKDANVRVETFPIKRNSLIHASYVVKRSEDIACIYVMSEKALEVEAIGGGSHPSVLVNIYNAKSGSFEISFIDFNEDWIVFSAITEKSGVKVTLIKQR